MNDADPKVKAARLAQEDQQRARARDMHDWLVALLLDQHYHHVQTWQAWAWLSYSVLASVILLVPALTSTLNPWLLAVYVPYIGWQVVRHRRDVRHRRVCPTRAGGAALFGIGPEARR